MYSKPPTVTTVKENLLPMKEIKNIQFALSSPEDIVKQSVCKIDSVKLLGRNSVYDPRMGSMEQDELCESCGEGPKVCPGHCGHIELNTFVLHPMYMRYITNFLKCLCFRCFRVVLTGDHLNLDGFLKYQGDNRFEKVVEKLEKVDSCFHCKSPKPKIFFQQKTCDIAMKYDKTRIVITDTEIKKIFDNVPNEDVSLIGFDPKFMHPKDLVLSVLQVLPPRARPYVISDGITCDDDLTISLCEIVKANKNLADPNVKDAKREKSIQTLKFRIKTMMNNSAGRARHSNGRPMKGIKERLSGKGGLIRKNLMGKRRNQSGRSPISADPTVRTDELVVPEAMACVLTVPDTVASFNFDYLQQLVDNGKANFVIRNENTINLKYAMIKKGTQLLWGDKVLRDGVEFNTDRFFELKDGDKIIRRDGEIVEKVETKKTKSFNIEIGDIVERHLKDGDVVIFNRQPTLHKGSMLAKRVLVRPGKTLRFNLASTKSFNADFDGDEMNVLNVLDCDARAELLNLSTTKHNIMSCQSTKNIICITQDALLGAFLLTRDDIDIGKERFFDLCMKGDEWSMEHIFQSLERIQKVMKTEGYNFPLYCGKSIFSLMLPPTMSYSKKNEARGDQPIVKIVKGVMLEGALNKANLGSAHNSLIHFIHKEYGMKKAIDFINNVQFISNQFLLQRSFTIGIMDCITNISKQTEEIAYKSFIEAKDIEMSISHKRIRELKVCAILDKARDTSQKLARKSMGKKNGFVATVTSGSKGEFFNITQITSMLGQQQHMGERIRKVFNRGKRTLACYPIDQEKMTVEQEFESRGFIKHSFLHGINPQEFIWHAMTGREGCSDTAMKSVTWETMIIVIDNYEPRHIEIGKWIDDLLQKNIDKVEHYSDRQMELLNVENILIPTTSDSGLVSWGAVTAVTRHDPGVKLYKISTQSGRSVTVTESKSLIVWNKEQNKFLEVPTPDIKLGDFLPVTGKLCDPPVTNSYDGSVGFCAGFWIPNDKPLSPSIFMAPNSYVKEFLNGCFFNRSKIFSKCSKFVEGMAHLCGRVGLFGKIENDGISLEKIDLFNDVILDMIVDITLVDVKHHPKVYDLTVPSTLNFSLANGLQVRDTANSGYVQRKMVKVFEDLQVKYDGTVRGSNDWISEWQYGGDGFDRTCCAVKNGESFFCDVDNIANRLNNEHELGM